MVSNGDQNNTGQQQGPNQLVENVENLEDLYIGHIDEVIGLVNGGQKVRFEGEVMLYGRTEGQAFVVERLRRVALYGALVEPPDPKDNKVGIISLAGPLYPVRFQPGPTGSLGDLRLQLHYLALSELEPLNPSKDATFPRVEMLTALLNWEQDGPIEGREVPLKFGLPASALEREELSLVQSVTFEPIGITFRPADSKPPQNAQHHSLEDCPPPGLPCDGLVPTPVRQFRLRFTNASGRPTGTLMAGCQVQINGVCEVWRNKAALDPIVEPDIYPFRNLNGITDAKLSLLRTLAASTPNHVDVYIVEGFQLQRPIGGGYTCDGGTASAFCMLRGDVLNHPNFTYLLAHELGHVLGISDSDGDPTISYPGMVGPSTLDLRTFFGSPGSVMDGALNSPINTSANMEIFSTWPNPLVPAVRGVVPLNSIVTGAGWSECFRPN